MVVCYTERLEEDHAYLDQDVMWISLNFCADKMRQMWTNNSVFSIDTMIFWNFLSKLFLTTKARREIAIYLQHPFVAHFPTNSSMDATNAMGFCYSITKEQIIRSCNSTLVTNALTSSCVLLNEQFQNEQQNVCNQNNWCLLFITCNFLSKAQAVRL